MNKNLLKSLLVAGMLAVGMGVQAKEDVTSKYLLNADLNSLDGWNHVGYTDWKTDGTVPVIEFWNWSAQFNFDQTIVLPAGDYRLAVNSFYRESWGGNGTNKDMAWIFAGEKKQNVVALNSMSDLSGYAGSNDLYRAATAFSLGKFSNEFDFSIESDGTEITIGFTGKTPDGGWCILGPVKLYQYTLEDYMVDYREKVAEANPYLAEKMSAETLAALKAAIVEESTLTSAADIADAIQKLNEAVTAAKASIAAYAKLKTALDKGDAFIQEAINVGGAPASCASALDAIKAEYDNGSIADVDIDAKIAEIDAILLTIVKQQTKVGSDMTRMLVNPDYEQDEYGWTVVAAEGTGPNGRQGNVRPGGSAVNHCYEAWNNSEFDIYQEVADAPAGVYEISVQGFYRYGRDNAWTDYLAQEVDYVKPAGVPVYIYLNNNATNFTNVFGDPVQITDETFYSAGSTDYNSQIKDETTYYFPNGMASAAIAFSDGMYTQAAYGLVAKAGDQLRIGVKGNSSQLNDSWVIWDNFKLIYRGFDPDVIKPVLENEIKNVNDNFIGLLMGKTEYAAFTTALAAAEKAITDNDGEGMFNALNALYDAKDPALTSKDIFVENEVKNDTTRLAQAIRDVAEAKMANSTRANANTLLDGLMKNLIYENDQIDQLKQDVTDMIAALYNSIALYSNLNSAVADLASTIIVTEGTENIDAATLIANAKMLKDAAAQQYEAGTIDDDKVEARIQEIYNMIAQLRNAIDIATGINAMSAGSVNNAPAYNMGGQQIKSQKGLYIQSGKKVVKK